MKILIPIAAAAILIFIMYGALVNVPTCLSAGLSGDQEQITKFCGAVK